jgi:integrase/recombinase XerC
MNNDHSPTSRPDEIKAARMLLEKMGINPADLIRAPADPYGVPTFAEYIPRVSGAVSSGTRRVYGSYWNRVIQAWGPRPITEVTASDIGQLAEQVKATVVTRRNARGGRGAAEHLIAALRCLYKHAVADGILTESDNPAARVPKPRRLRSTRTALPTAASRRFSESPRPQVMTLLSTLCCFGCIRRPPAGGEALWR